MAIIKSIDTDIGIPAIYWRIRRAELGYSTPSAAPYVVVTVEGYASRDARGRDKAAITSAVYEIPLQAGDDPDGFTRPGLYAWLKKQVRFNGAQDG